MPCSLRFPLVIALLVPGCPETVPNPAFVADAGRDAGGVDAPVVVDAPRDAPRADACERTFYADADGDGFGDPDAGSAVMACEMPTGFVDNDDDCDDTTHLVSPGDVELCDAAMVDEDCSGSANDGCLCTDGMTQACPGGTDVGECTAGSQTCDLTGAWGACVGMVGPTSEVCNGRDDDCDGATDGATALAACTLTAGVMTAMCSGTAGCEVAACVPARGDCNVDYSDGCEMTLGTVNDCTACGDRCGWDCEAAGCNDGTLVTAGSNFSCAVRENGRVVCWGDRTEGRLGDGSTSGTSMTPVTVGGLIASLRITAIAAGTSHVCAIAMGGQVYCWGDNDHGQLGVGASPADSAVPVMASISNAIAIDAGEDFTCALRTGGVVSCWGWDFYSQIGNGAATATDVLTPYDVPLPRAASGIATGDRHACAVVNGTAMGTATVYCWGLGSDGRIGDGAASSRESPVLVGGGFTGYTLIAAGRAHTCALLAVGSPSPTYTLRCWGANGSGQLGDATMMERRTPTLVSGLARLTGLAAGADHTCVRSDTATWCWGEAGNGQIGSGTVVDQPSPVMLMMVSGGYPLRSIATGGGHSCGVEADGTVTCWGNNAALECGTTGLMLTTPAVVTAP